MDAVFQLEHAVFNYRVAGVLIENGHVLIHKQANDEHWALPGGRVEVLEDSRTSIRREIDEELGYAVSVDKLLWVTENFFEYNNKNYHELGFYYLISLKSETAIFQKDDFYGLEGERLIYKWVPISELENIQLYPEFLRTALKFIPQSPQHLIIRQL
ncbi:NUDIX hydrolase [Lederbergia citrea]|uniref:NUDIX hydrolase n=1 Tax=Lederbergia citrea TaxID=2833581 RepID=UPI001BC99510|nr:NUDIX hydrolase [Lederbergia citrea]MBS4202548.1 NUDIX hydrolase [Lederbergia citrea]